MGKQSTDGMNQGGGGNAAGGQGKSPKVNQGYQRKMESAIDNDGHLQKAKPAKKKR